MKELERYNAILKILAETYPDARPGLNFKSPFELLIATVLSAQCTDKRVNQVTQTLFRDYHDAEAIAAMPQSLLEDYIHSCGVYKNKASNIIATCKILVDEYNGEVPHTMDELIRLPGVGRKTANVVMSNAFGIDAIAVDTHVFRVSNRLGLAHASNAEKTEEELMRNIPKDQWSAAHHWIITHGRQICSARKPRCDQCPLQSLCDYVVEPEEK